MVNNKIHVQFLVPELQDTNCVLIMHVFIICLPVAYIAMAQHSETDSNIEMWKMKKLIKILSAVKGDGTSLISLVVNPRDKIPRVTKMLGEEYQNASKIKKRMNRQSVQAAITYAQSRLKLYKNVPSNGLVLFTGTGVTEDGEEKKFAHDLVPFKPINSSLYVCDSSFHTEAVD